MDAVGHAPLIAAFAVVGTKQEFLLIAAIMFVGSGVLSFYCIRDGLIRKSVRIGALRRPLEGRAAVVLSVVWLVWAAIGFGLGVWFLMQGLAKPGGSS